MSGGFRDRLSAGFVGRDNEVSSLLDALAEARAGRGGLFLVHGEPGIGKTRLVEEFSDLALAEGARVLWGRCWEGGGAPAYLPWSQALRSCLRRTEWADSATLLGRSGQYIASLVPEIRDRVGAGGAPSTLHGEDERFALFDAVRELLFNLAEAETIVVVLDDLHAADGGSLLLLKYLAEQARRVPVLLVGVYREVEARFAPGTEALLTDLGREAAKVPLRGLGVAEVSLVIANVANRAVSTPLAEAIQRHTEGNPLFVDATVRLLAADGRLDDPDVSRSLRVPDVARATISRRLAFLSPEARAALTVAAVIGRDFDTELLAQAGGIDPALLAGMLDEAARVGVMAPGSGSFGRASFAHALFREILYEEAEPKQRAALHALVAEALERFPSSELDPRLSELAHHWYEARIVSPGDRRWVACAIRAADRAMAVQGYEDAIVLYERAIREGAPGEDHGFCDLLLALGEAQWRAGAVDDARRTFLRAAELSRTLGSAHHLARAALGYASGVTVYALREPDESISALLREADAALGEEESPLRVRVLARLALEKLWVEDVSAREEVSRRALDIAERLGDDRVLSWALYARCHATWSPEGIEDRMALIARILQLASEASDDEMSFLGHLMLCRTFMHLADVPAVESELTTCVRLADRMRVPLYREQAHAIKLIRPLYYAGSFEEANVLIEAVADFSPPASADFIGQMAVARLWLDLFAGHTGTLAAGFRMIRERYPQVSRLFAAFVAWALLEADEREEGRREYEIVLRGGPLPKNDLWIVGMHAASLACARLGDRESAEFFRERLVPYADRMTAGGIASCIGSTAHPLACLSATLERWDEAFAYFDQAFQVNLAAHRPMAAVVLRDKAAALLARNGAEDAPEALRVAEEALSMMRRMHMTGWIPSTEALALRAREAAGPSGAMLRRDREGWLLRFAGEQHRLKDAKGLHHLARLLATTYQESHVLDLVSGVEGGGPPNGGTLTRTQLAELGLRATHLAQTGPLLDAEAKAAYRARLTELEAEREEAERWNDTERAATLAAEIDAITHELAGAVGPGGRDRRASPEAERARVNVSRSIKAAIRQIAEVCPEAGRHLAGAVRTGWFCSYAPSPSERVSWTV